MKHVIMTQDNCPQCERLKLLLAKPMKGKYDDMIEYVHRTENPEKFEELRNQYGVQATPTLINTESGEVLRDFSSGPRVAKFLDS